MINKTVRKIKLHSKHRFINKGWNREEVKVVPWLNISGIWLDKAGFHAGNQLEVIVKPNQLIIRNATSKNTINKNKAYFNTL